MFAGGIVVLGCGAWIWARAFAEVQRARVHRQSADANDETMAAAEEATDELSERRHERLTMREPVAATDEEIMRELLEQRRDVTTFSNENVAEDTGIPPDNLWPNGEAEEEA